jgi:predicted phosphodiesterase
MESPLRNLKKTTIFENGIDQVKEAAQWVANLTANIAYQCKMKVDVHFMSGNHDRATVDGSEDYTRVPYQSMIEIARLNLVSWGYGKFFQFHNSTEGRTGSFDLNESYRIVYFHGDACSKVERLVMIEKSSKHKIMIQGHLHYRQFLETGLGYTHIVSPSLCGASSYEIDELGYIGTPGQTLLISDNSELQVVWL